MANPTLYKQILIWKHLEDGAVRYCCFENLASHQYCVQSADFFRLPIENKQLTSSNIQMVELFMEVEPRERCMWFDSLESAITAHDQAFSNSPL